MRRLGLLRRRSSRLALALSPLCLGLTGCGPEPIITPVRNLERPSEMDFVCLKVPNQADDGVPAGPRLVGGRHMTHCKDPRTEDPKPLDGAGNRRLAVFGLVTNTARAEVGAIDLDGQRLVDLDVDIPGFNQIPVGSLPESISSSDDGCWAVTANRGSCDLSLLNPARALTSYLGAQSENPAEVVKQIRVKTASGELRAAPFEIAFVPTVPVDLRMPEGGKTLAPIDTPACMATPSRSWRAVITFPSCDLVALVSLPDGQVLSSVRVLPDGQVINTGTNPVCAADCGAGAGSAADAGGAQPPLAVADASGDQVVGLDAGAAEGRAADAVSSVDTGAIADGGAPISDAALAGPPAASTGPQGIGAVAVTPAGDRVYVAGARSSVITALGIGPGGFVQLPEGGAIPLHENPGGITRLRLSVNRFGVPKAGGPFVGDRGQFLYAFARDGSVRVVEIGGRDGNPVAPGECDVNIDFDRANLNKAIPCIRVGDATRPPRLLLESGPGLRVPVRFDPDVAPPVPVDIAFTDLSSNLAIGMLLASNGQIYQIALATPGDASLLPTHSARPSPEGPNTRGGGAARVLSEPIRSFTDTRVAFPTRVGFPSNSQGPRLESYRGDDGDSLGEIQRWMRFPRTAAVPEQVDIRWEGILPGTIRVTGSLAARTGPPGSGIAAIIDDVGADFCRASVEPGDVLTVAGCEQDRECDINADEVCYRVTASSQGTCLPRRFVADETRLRDCRSELASRRRYEVLDVRKRQMVLGLKLDEVPRPRLAPCQLAPADRPDQVDPVCQPDPAHRPDPTLSGDKGFQCLAWKPDQARCLKSCGVRDAANNWVLRDDLCRAGHVCADLGHATLGPLCVEAPMPRGECTPRDTRYMVQAGNSFLVRSQAIPYFTTTREEPEPGRPEGGRCLRDTTFPRSIVQRIPLSAPRCQTVPENEPLAMTIVRNLDGEPAGANPCLLLTPNGDDSDDGARTPHWKALFENPHYRFALTNLETYVGDAAAIFVDVTGGFSPLRVTSTGGAVIGLGARIITGPSDSADTGVALGTAAAGLIAPPPYLFVIDQGRTLTQFSRGQVLRINPRPLESVRGGFIDSIETDSYFPIQ